MARPDRLARVSLSKTSEEYEGGNENGGGQVGTSGDAGEEVRERVVGLGWAREQPFDLTRDVSSIEDPADDDDG